jgi:methionyl-tRNA formyltransferase
MLPKYRGPSPVQTALLNGDTNTGTSIFILDEAVDHGPILATKVAAIDPDDTNITLQAKLAAISSELLLDTLPKYQAGQITPQEQSHGQATSAKMISKEDGLIDWSNPAQQIYNQFRAYQPWPGIYTIWQDKKLKILDCRLSEDKSTLELITVQLEGKNPTSIKDFKNGYPNFEINNLK